MSLAEFYARHFQTPKEVGLYMKSLIPPGTRTILEPTPGIGNLVNLLPEYEVTAPKDFFLLEKQRFDCIIMNPPFSSKYAFTENAPKDKDYTGMKIGYQMVFDCMEMSDHVIALAPWFIMADSDVRMRRFMEFGLRSVTILPRKTFNYARIQTVIMELHKGFHSAIHFKVLQ